MVNIPYNLKYKWKGSWIWAKTFRPRRKKFGDRQEEIQGITFEDKNAHVLFRKKFTVEKTPKQAILKISVDSRYKLYVNEHYIGRGIPRCERWAWVHDVHDVTKFIKEGENIIAIQAVYFGEPLAWYQPIDSAMGSTLTNSAKGGVVFELDVTDENGGARTIVSDKNTKAFICDAYQRNAPKKNGTLGRVDIVDLRKYPSGWRKMEYDDSNWENAMEISYPLEYYIERQIPLLREIEINPEKVLHFGEVENVDFEDDLEDDEEPPDFCIINNMEIPEPLSKATIKGMDYILKPKEGKFCEITSPGQGRSVFLLLDFGKNMSGYMHFLVDGEEGTIIDMIPAERMAGKQVDNGDTLTQKRGMSVTLSGGLQEFEQTLWDGFRYVMVKIRNVKDKIMIYRLNTVFTSYPYENKGVFECNDEDLNDLWKACAYTLVLCTHDGYEDCPWREQRSYPGDFYVENLINYATFGDYDIGKKSVYDVAFSQLSNGMTFSFVCGDAYLENHIIPNYQLYWIFTIESHYLYSGDEQTVKNLYTEMIKGLEWWEKYIDPDTKLLKNVPYWKFIDWNEGLDNNAEINAIVNAQYYWALKIVEKYSRMMGWQDKAEKLDKIAEDIKRGINIYLWDEERSVYHDGINNGKKDNVISQQTNAFLIFLEIAPPSRWDKIIHEAFDIPVKNGIQIPIKKRGYKPSPNEVLIPQPFFMHFVNQAFAKTGRFDLMFHYFKKGWIRMLKHQDFAGTIWETWEQHGSRTHAWAATPAFDLTTHVAGIRPIEPGFNKFLIEPEFHELNWIKCNFPSIKGDIYLSMKKTSDQMEFSIRIPEMLDEKGTFLSPRKAIGKIEKVTINNREIPLEDAIIESGRVKINALPAGVNEIKIKMK
ncbi:MAG: family 78 glycoside hydrolase catalytic domain [Promethearchaeota archaeon]